MEILLYYNVLRHHASNNGPVESQIVSDIYLNFSLTIINIINTLD